jgi:hypothetical protein
MTAVGVAAIAAPKMVSLGKDQVRPFIIKISRAKLA